MNIKEIENIEFRSIDKNGEEKYIKLSDFKGKHYVIYFYPQDGTSGCTKQAGDFRDAINDGVLDKIVIGVNADDTHSHKKFIENNDLNFILICDPKRILIKHFDVWGEKPKYGKGYMGIIRSSFIIGPDGNITKEWRDINVDGHVDEIVKEFEKIR